LADSRSAALAEFGLVLTDGLTAVHHRGQPLEPARIEKVSSVVERCGLGWVARMTRASLALTSQADGCDAAHAVHDDCERDSDAWGAALALLLEGLGGCAPRMPARRSTELWRRSTGSAPTRWWALSASCVARHSALVAECAPARK
jgi:hypothetical protein